ncbi:SNF3 [Symbiodinium natans]|uniref:SNF3 protein n=1 Tax=Symbiodinium natans TaxID=878477 RepID=A0A812LL75_9DINO|nr:SNF3 [Symbiodinium natans]
MPFEEVRALLTQMQVTDKELLDDGFVAGSGGWEISTAVCLFVALGGMLLGIEIQLDIEQGEIRFFALGGIVGPLLAVVSCLIDSLGRLGFLWLGGIGFCIGAAVQRFYPSQSVLPNGACISGAAAGLLCASIPIFQGEVSHPEHRGAMVTAYQLAIAFGILVTSSLEVWVHPSVSTSDVMVLVLAGLLTGGVYFLPNSYRWLVSRRRFKEALELARRTCGSSQDVRLEIAMCYKEFRRERKLGSRHATSNAAAESAPAACRSLSFVTWQGNGQAKLG